ncbi:ATP-dependent DNA helicase RecG [Chitinophaga pinensis]|uniref:ATP-dependent DNA helicase RecG n=1 Tax=Chitinophaga pinensis (strain ATCC 43595 / DSM 2588 / LMG 13176 / NBRC 15968 / NCIMB 11800 / UQM 2034) TaxID=485918 RepID=A0A979GBC6_CHIPD|nr:ATP-dependent DNA helicase RecG [Chitinophaga pinensis]ACU64316.1 ATP-dependent DNA helicase RecG [Chitinophaga pinensis DSM 2588]
MDFRNAILSNPIEYLKGVGPQRGELLRKEIGVHTFRDLLYYFPFRYVDRTNVEKIISLHMQMDYVQIRGKITRMEVIGDKRAKRLVATLRDETGEISLVWFQGWQWVEKSLQTNVAYLVFGKIAVFNGYLQMSHPEMDLVTEETATGKQFLEPVYYTTEKLKARGLTAKAIGKLTKNLLEQLSPGEIPENIPTSILQQYRLMDRAKAHFKIHLPVNEDDANLARRRLKFEELFIAQIRICRLKIRRQQSSRGFVFNTVGDAFNTFYNEHLPFTLTGAQKRVLKEIRQDTATGRQMNRLIQGDVGSGKTMVALLTMLLAVDNGFQACLMAPTEILSQQHYKSISELLEQMPVKVALLTGNVKGKARKQILKAVEEGEIHILIGTHALLEPQVVFKNLGMAIVDEQHRFGVAQRARLWQKNTMPPHILVMTATPIPRTLAMTVYGDLDVSVIDELPPGRKPITTVHRTEFQRPQVMDFIKEEIRKGRQAYIVYPLIEDSETLDYENLMKGYEEVKAFFPEPQYYISMVHGRQPVDMKETNMQRFVKGDTQIMVATTVIEVGVNVPNASVMVIESTERFGLSQLHQLRGRVGRGAEQSFCILMTGNKVGADSKERIQVMVQTNDGFVISEKDMELRGPGDIEGTRQSGLIDLKLADIVEDRPILEAARASAEKLLQEDPDLSMPENQSLQQFLAAQQGKSQWSKIS